MPENGKQSWNRRHVLTGAAALALVIGGSAAVVVLNRPEPDVEPSDRQRELMREVSQLVIPHTGTAGAGEVGTGDFVILALGHGLMGSRDAVPAEKATEFHGLRRADGSLRHLAWLERELDRRGRGDFLRLSGPERLGVLTAFDAEAFAPGAASPWKTIKALILTGYYTSEVGGSQELRYKLVPGRWDPDIPLEPGARAWSSDWTAVDFG